MMSEDAQLMRLCARFLDLRKEDKGHRLSFATRGALENLNYVTGKKMSARECELWCHTLVPWKKTK